MSDKLMWKTLVVAVVFFLLSMSGMLVYANEKAVVITEGSHEELLANDYAGQLGLGKPKLQEPRSFAFDVDTKVGDRLCIPLQSGIKAEKVIIENRYMEEELHITILGGDVEFYNKKELYGDLTGVKAGTYEESAIGVLMKFSLTDIFECKSVLEGGNLYIRFVKPTEQYDKIVVIDPVYGEEKDIALDVAKRLKKKLDATGIKAFFTRLEDEAVPEEKRLELIERVEADFLLSIGASFDETDGKKYGTEVIYNGNFFTPKVNSVELADACLRQVVTHISGRGNGLIVASEDVEVIWDAQVPAVLLRVGYLTNEQEAALLAREDYRERIAEGIYQAIVQIYEKE